MRKMVFQSPEEAALWTSFLVHKAEGHYDLAAQHADWAVEAYRARMPKDTQGWIPTSPIPRPPT